MPMQALEAERLFAGPLAEEYEILRQVCPAAAEMGRRVGAAAASWRPGRPLRALEIGCGTGVSTLPLLAAREDLFVTALDNEPAMLSQARANLAGWLARGRLELRETDALAGLQALPAASLDLVASCYAVHNFTQAYRERVLEEVFRVLAPGGAFVNGDRYALDDPAEHTRLAQEELRGWFKTFAQLGRIDLLEQWAVHLLGDESEGRVMRLGPALASLERIGFAPVEVRFREGVNTLLVAAKPGGGA